MERTPKFLIDFSKQEHSQERFGLAQKIRQRRQEERGMKAELSGVVKKKEETAEQLEKLEKDLNGARNKLYRINSHTLGYILHYFEIRKIRAELSDGKDKQKDLLSGLETLSGSEVALNFDLKGTEHHGKSDAVVKMLKEFYERQKIEWAKSPYEKEDIAKYFNEEHLANLDLKSYELLLSRFPADMVTHVTRQGIRDHVGMLEHQTGKGKMHNGFERLLSDGRLRSSLGLVLVEGMKEETVAKVLNLDRFETEEEAKKYLDYIINDSGLVATYEDRTAVHVASEEVADAYYGAESSNEIFLAYPAAHVASQYFFRGGLGEHPGSTMNNDKWIWTKENRGMDINAAIVFIPKSTRVDRKTGSRYFTDSQGIPSPSGDGFELATDTISSQEFWENYFQSHPGLKPSKIIYYDGNDPTSALNEWRSKAGLWKRTNSPDMGFPENKIDDKHPKAKAGKGRFVSLAREIIKKYYQNKQEKIAF